MATTVQEIYLAAHDAAVKQLSPLSEYQLGNVVKAAFDATGFDPETEFTMFKQHFLERRNTLIQLASVAAPSVVAAKLAAAKAPAPAAEQVSAPAAPQTQASPATHAA